MYKLPLSNSDKIVAVVPEHCYGSGWSNPVVWVFVESADCTIRRECLEPHEQNEKLHLLFELGDVLCHQLISAVPTISEEGER